MSHDNREAIELYKTHEKEVKQHILMDMTTIFDVEDMLHAVIWKFTCDSINYGIPSDERKAYIYKKIEKEIIKWVKE